MGESLHGYTVMEGTRVVFQLCPLFGEILPQYMVLLVLCNRIQWSVDMKVVYSHLMAYLKFSQLNQNSLVRRL